MKLFCTAVVILVLSVLVDTKPDTLLKKEVVIDKLSKILSSSTESVEKEKESLEIQSKNGTNSANLTVSESKPELDPTVNNNANEEDSNKERAKKSYSPPAPPSYPAPATYSSSHTSAPSYPAPATYSSSHSSGPSYPAPATYSASHSSTSSYPAAPATYSKPSYPAPTLSYAAPKPSYPADPYLTPDPVYPTHHVSHHSSYVAKPTFGSSSHTQAVLPTPTYATSHVSYSAPAATSSYATSQSAYHVSKVPYYPGSPFCIEIRPKHPTQAPFIVCETPPPEASYHVPYQSSYHVPYQRPYPSSSMPATHSSGSVHQSYGQAHPAYSLHSAAGAYQRADAEEQKPAEQSQPVPLSQSQPSKQPQGAHPQYNQKEQQQQHQHQQQGQEKPKEEKPGSEASHPTSRTVYDPTYPSYPSYPPHPYSSYAVAQPYPHPYPHDPKPHYGDYTPHTYVPRPYPHDPKPHYGDYTPHTYVPNKPLYPHPYLPPTPTEPPAPPVYAEPHTHYAPSEPLTLNCQVQPSYSMPPSSPIALLQLYLRPGPGGSVPAYSSAYRAAEPAGKDKVPDAAQQNAQQQKAPPKETAPGPTKSPATPQGQTREKEAELLEQMRAALEEQHVQQMQQSSPGYVPLQQHRASDNIDQGPTTFTIPIPVEQKQGGSHIQSSSKKEAGEEPEDCSMSQPKAAQGNTPPHRPGVAKDAAEQLPAKVPKKPHSHSGSGRVTYYPNPPIPVSPYM